MGDNPVRPWGIILSGMDPVDIREFVGEMARCCCDSGAGRQIHRILTEHAEEEEERDRPIGLVT